jgi:hypothetical protein
MTFTRTLNPPVSIALGLLAAALVGLMLVLVPGRGEAQAPPTVNIAQITLSGAQEVPPNTENATGFFSATVTANSMTFDLSAVADGITMAHIHLGAAGTNGPIVAFLFGPVEAPGQPSIHPTGTLTAANLIGPIANDWAAFAQALAAGNLYVNVHSVEFPAGVVRAQIPATASAGLVTPTATAAASPTPGAPPTGTGVAGDGVLNWPAVAGMVLIVAAASGVALQVARRRA